MATGLSTSTSTSTIGRSGMAGDSFEYEYEHGVAIPGRILPESQWVKTAVKRLPAPGAA